MKVKINNESELYNTFDKFDETLSEDLISYINNKSQVFSLRNNEPIEIISFMKIDENKFNNAFQKYCNEQLLLVNRRQKLNTTKEIWLLLIGIIFIIFSITLTNKINVIILNIISTIGSFSIWEASNSWLLESKNIKFNKIKTMRLKDIKIEYKYENE